MYQSLLTEKQVLREFQPSMGVLKALKLQLVAVFEEGERLGVMEREEEELHKTLLWILCCAGTVWLSEQDKAWFSKRIAAQVVYLRLRTWGEVENVLMRFLWIRGMCREKAESLWLEVEMLGTAATWMGVLGF